MSGTEDLDMVYTCLKLGADHYILKPLKEKELLNLWQTIYKRRKELKVVSQLGKEKSKSSELAEKTERLQMEINNLKEQVDRAVELPIRIIHKEIETLLSHTNLPAEIILSTILKQLRYIHLDKDTLFLPFKY